jgi:hypothetical protein
MVTQENPNTTSRTTVYLSSGLNIDGTFTKTINMRRPKVKDFCRVETESAKQKLDNDTITAQTYMIANLCDLSPDQVMDMEWEDFMICVEQLTNFLEKKGTQKKTG